MANYPWDDHVNGRSDYSATPDDKLFISLAETYAQNHVDMSDSNQFPGISSIYVSIDKEFMNPNHNFYQVALQMVQIGIESKEGCRISITSSAIPWKSQLRWRIASIPEMTQELLIGQRTRTV